MSSLSMHRTLGPHGMPAALEHLSSALVRHAGPPVTRMLAAVPWNPLSQAITHYGQRDESGHTADCVVVLGCGTNPDGTASPALRARVENAEWLFSLGRAPNILFTGGKNPNGHIEAEAARQQALADGLPASHLFVEDQSRTTWENLVNARSIMAQDGWHSCLISTAPYHERRSMAMAHELGLTAYAAPTHVGPEVEDPACVKLQTAREGVATLLYDMSHWSRILRRHTA